MKRLYRPNTHRVRIAYTDHDTEWVFAVVYLAATVLLAVLMSVA